MKGLEALKVIYDLEDLQGGRDEFWNAYRIIEKELKALEIIRENVSLDDNLDFLIIHSILIENKEEYDLLNEVLL